MRILVYFSKHGCIVHEPRMGKIVGTGCKVGCLFELVSPAVPSKAIAHCGIVLSSELWYSCLGHISFSRLRPLIPSGLLGTVDVNKVDCQSCQLAKFHDLPFNNNDFVSQAPFDLGHSDIWGPASTTTMGGSLFLLFLWIIFLDIHGFISLKIDQNCSKFITTLLP